MSDNNYFIFSTTELPFFVAKQEVCGNLRRVGYSRFFTHQELLTGSFNFFDCERGAKSDVRRYGDEFLLSVHSEPLFSFDFSRARFMSRHARPRWGAADIKQKIDFMGRRKTTSANVVSSVANELRLERYRYK